MLCGGDCRVTDGDDCDGGDCRVTDGDDCDGGDCRVTDGDDCMIVCDRSVNKRILNNNGMNK